MDHLPRIANSKPYPVRCLCTINDSFNPFVLGYPEYKGWLMRPGIPIGRLDGTPITPDETAAFIQEWLFFGLLADALKLAGLEVSFQDFVRKESVGDNSDCQVVTTARLSEYLDKWHMHERDVDVGRRRERQSLLVQILKPHMEFVHRLDYSRQSVPMDLDVLLSILILGETIKNAAAYIWRLDTNIYPLRIVSFVRRHNPLMERLVQSGRCLTETVMLHRKVDNTGLYVASLIPWPQVLGKRGHEACTMTDCVAYQVDDAAYETVHATDCSNSKMCPFVSVDVNKAASILRSGDIPLVRVVVRGDGKGDDLIEPKLYSSASGAPYVAISHIWAHGLGNPNSNALPRCQLLRLKDLASTLFHVMGRNGEPLIWIDTLCIPVSPSLREYRNLAISRIPETFSNSLQVLVLDAELQQASFRCTRVELAMRVLCSGWSRRLWTLQEAVMSEKASPNLQKLRIQMRERSMALNYLLELGLGNLYYTEKAIQSIFTSFPQCISPIDNFTALSSALEYRTTSKSADEPICLASILGLDVRIVVEAGSTSEARMCAFYAQMTEFPSEIIFHQGDGLETEGYRWAPRSFLSSGPSKTIISRVDLTNTSHRDERGLHVRYPGFIISVMAKRTHSMGYHFHFVDPEDPNTFWCLHPEGVTHNTLASPEAWHQEQARLAEFDRQVSESKILGLILTPKVGKVRECVLVRLKDAENKNDEKDDREIWGTYIFRASIYRRATDGRSMEDLEREKGLRVIAREVPAAQRWCVA